MFVRVGFSVFLALAVAGQMSTSATAHNPLALQFGDKEGLFEKTNLFGSDELPHKAYEILAGKAKKFDEKDKEEEEDSDADDEEWWCW